MIRFKDLSIDKNGDEKLSQAEIEATSPKKLYRYVSSLIKGNPEKHSRNSNQAWLFPDRSTDEIFSRIQTRVTQVTGIPKVLLLRSDFQVVNYPVEGHYNAHHDSSDLDKKKPCCTRDRSTKCRICRYMTLLFYLNDVEQGGETAFLVAGNASYDETIFQRSDLKNLHKNCDKAKVLIPPTKGKAVIWYNHFVDESSGWLGELDIHTWHGGCPVKTGEKWIANFWIKVTDDKEHDLSRFAILRQSL